MRVAAQRLALVLALAGCGGTGDTGPTELCLWERVTDGPEPDDACTAVYSCDEEESGGCWVNGTLTQCRRCYEYEDPTYLCGATPCD